MTRRADPDALEALRSNAAEASRAEVEYVRQEAHLDRRTPYCHGKGWPVILLDSAEDYSRRVELSRAAVRARN